MARAKSRTLWAGVIVAVVLGAGGYFGFTLLTGSDTGAETGETQLVPVTRGDLVNDVSVTGSLTYKVRETVGFGQQGVVSEVSVSEGDAVSEGDVLALLDAETIANLERAVAQARVDVRDAEDAVEEASSPYTAAQIARAESDAANALLDLRKAEDELSEAEVVPASLRAQASLDVVNARAELEAARERKAELENPTPQQVTRAKSAVTAAQVALQDARDDLDSILSPSQDDVADELASREADLVSAENALAGARFDLQEAERKAEEAISAAMDDLGAVQDDYSVLFQKWLGMTIGQPYARTPEEILASHGSDLDAIFDESQFQLRNIHLWSLLDEESSIDDPATPWDETVLFTWLVLYPGEVVVDCDDLELQDPDVGCVGNELADAYEPVRERSDSLETLQGQHDESIRKARAAVSDAEYTVSLRREALSDYIEEVASEEVDALDLEYKTRAIETAEADLFDAEASLAELMNADDADVEHADRDIELAEARLADAEEALAELIRGPDPVELRVKLTAIRLAEESLAEVEETLVEFSSVDQLEIELREADLVAAQASLDAAVDGLRQATLRAPFDGVVVAVNVEVGEQVNPNTQAFEVADPSVVEVSGSVDEIDVLFLQVGAQAFVSLEALGTQTLQGAVSSIANQGISQQGVVTYPVTVRLDSLEGAQLPEGLTATAQVIIREQTDALLIPLQALYGSVQAPTVRVVDEAGVDERNVTLGISDDFWVVVEEGLQEGETISMEVVGSATSQFGGIGATFRAVGGFGPGGPGGGGRQPGGAAP